MKRTVIRNTHVIPTPPREPSPTLMDILVEDDRIAAVGPSLPADGAEAVAIVYYIPTDEDELLISTMRGRAKAKAVTPAGKASLCILDERWPFAYLQVYCDARLDDDSDLVVDVMMAGAERMSGQPLPREARPAVEAMAKEEDRVVIRCRPSTSPRRGTSHARGRSSQRRDKPGMPAPPPPRHVSNPSDLAGLVDADGKMIP